MKKVLTDTNLDEKQRVWFVYFLHVFTTILYIILDGFYTETMLSFWFLVTFVGSLFVYRFLYSSIKKLFYSYWGLTVFILLFLVKNIIAYSFSDLNSILIWLLLLSLVTLFMSMYQMSSPIFYPRVQWWEYDFRYRGDIKIKVLRNEEESNARMSDFFYDVGCIESFKDFKIGETIDVVFKYESYHLNLKSTVKTIRKIIPGRPIRYGVKFSLPDEQTKHDLKMMRKLWVNYKNVKFREKFQNQS